MVASAVAGEGKTLTALNLAVTLSESYLRRVVLVDADLRCPRVHELLDSAPIHGLNEMLKAAHPTPLILTTVSPRLSILPAGQADPDPMGQLTGARMTAVLDELARTFDWVVVDTSPVVLLPDANLLAGMVDGAVIVIRAGVTSYDLVDRAIQELGRKRILGLILNQVDDKVSQYPRRLTTESRSPRYPLSEASICLASAAPAKSGASASASRRAIRALGESPFLRWARPRWK